MMNHDVPLSYPTRHAATLYPFQEGNRATAGEVLAASPDIRCTAQRVDVSDRRQVERAAQQVSRAGGHQAGQAGPAEVTSRMTW